MRYLFIIGAPKAGTSTLAQVLGRRADMYLGRQKEPRFFTDFHGILWTGPGADVFVQSMITDAASYEANFVGAEPGQWRIDASTDYLSCPASPALLKQWSQQHESRFICILRDPVDRAISEYQHTLRDRSETVSLAESLRLEPQRIRDHWQPLFHHVRRSRYHDDCLRYIDLFGDRILFLDFAALRAPAAVLARIEAFLGLAHEPIGTVEVVNASYVHRSETWYRLLRNDGLKSLVRPLLPQAIRKALWARLDRLGRGRYVPQAWEVEALRDALSSDIARCKADSRLPTGSWRS